MRKHKTALITGASGGLGLEFAKILAQKKYDLVLVARNEGKLYAVKNELEAEHGISVYPYAADLSAVDAALDVFNYTLENDIKIDVLINNAGFGDSGSFADSDWQKQYEMVQLNVVAMMQMTHCFLNPMIEQGHGKILSDKAVYMEGKKKLKRMRWMMILTGTLVTALQCTPLQPVSLPALNAVIKVSA